MFGQEWKSKHSEINPDHSSQQWPTLQGKDFIRALSELDKGNYPTQPPLGFLSHHLRQRKVEEGEKYHVSHIPEAQAH